MGEIVHWTDKERKHIAQHYPAIGARDLSKLVPGRTERAIYHMAKKMGLSKCHDRLREVGRENVGKRWEKRTFTEPPEISS